MTWGSWPYPSVGTIIFGVFSLSKKPQIIESTTSDDEYSSFLCRFVSEANGKHLGESVSIDGDILIIKRKDQFLGVPLKHISDDEKKLIVHGLIDFDKAYELGETWRTKSYQLLNNGEEAHSSD